MKMAPVYKSIKFLNTGQLFSSIFEFLKAYPEYKNSLAKDAIGTILQISTWSDTDFEITDNFTLQEWADQELIDSKIYTEAITENLAHNWT